MSALREDIVLVKMVSRGEMRVWYVCSIAEFVGSGASSSRSSYSA